MPQRLADLVGRGVVDGRGIGLVVEDVELLAVVRPRDELNVAMLRVEREILNVQRAVGLDQGWVHQQHLAVVRHDRIRHHVVVELVTGAVGYNNNNNNNNNNEKSAQRDANTARWL